MDTTPEPSADAEPFTLLNVFRVAAADQSALATSVLDTARDVAATLPGFLDATILASTDGERVAIFAHWRDRAAFDRFRADPGAAAGMARATEHAESDGHFYVTAGRVAAAGPLDTYRLMGRYLAEQAWDELADVVDIDGYTENCVGLTTGWITGFPTAVQAFRDNVAGAFSAMSSTELDAVEAGDQAVVRLLVEATHSGPFLGVAATGRRISYEAVDWVRLHGTKIAWRLLHMDLWGVHHQITREEA